MTKRQDGDELLPCPFCAKPIFRSSRKVNPSARCVTEGCYGTRMSVVNLDDPSCVAAWNSRATTPSTNGAEGAEDEWCPNCGSPAPNHNFGCFRAPSRPAPDVVRDIALLADEFAKSDKPLVFQIGSKERQWIEQGLRLLAAPAPDAMREAVKAAFTKHGHVNMKWPASAQIDDSHIDAFVAEISAAISAPVPSPDGAGEFKDIRWAVNVLLEKIAAKFDANETWDIWRSDAASIVRSFKHDLSPSGTGAAEPVAWTIPGDDQADCNGFIPTKIYREGEFTKPLYAAPPVRGDREVLRAEATKLWAKLCHECFAAPGKQCDCIDDIVAAFDAILSLPSAPVSKADQAGRYMTKEEIAADTGIIRAAPVSGRDAVRNVLSEPRMFWFLTILNGMGGETSAEGSETEWLQTFADDRGRTETDTINIAINAGLVSSHHDDRTDSGCLRMTDIGRKHLAAIRALSNHKESGR